MSRAIDRPAYETVAAPPEGREVAETEAAGSAPKKERLTRHSVSREATALSQPRARQRERQRALTPPWVAGPTQPQPQRGGPKWKPLRMSQSFAQIYVHMVYSTKNRKPWLHDEGVRDGLFRYLATISRGREVMEHSRSVHRWSRK
jgi:hypothetical protein